MKSIQTLAEKVGWGHLILTTGVFSGYAPVASGTFGTLPALPLYLGLLALGKALNLGWIPYLIITLLLFVLGVRGADKIETATQQQDNGIIVIDEVVGYLITMLLLPSDGPRWLLMLAGFLVFRLFDIVKPYPIRRLDKNPKLGGFGVMIDDVLAGVYGNLVLQILMRVVWAYAG
jgi:phosphatidylglycerophosphatase A